MSCVADARFGTRAAIALVHGHCEICVTRADAARRIAFAFGGPRHYLDVRLRWSLSHDRSLPHDQ
jgi:hypothetical protein